MDTSASSNSSKKQHVIDRHIDEGKRNVIKMKWTDQYWINNATSSNSSNKSTSTSPSHALDIFVMSRKLKNDMESPFDCLFKTHQYEFRIIPSDEFFDLAGSDTGFFVELKLYKKLPKEKSKKKSTTTSSDSHSSSSTAHVGTETFHEFSICGNPSISYTFQEEIANKSKENTWFLTLIWPSDQSRISFKGEFCFRLTVFRKIDEDNYRRICSKVSNEFKIVSKPGVYLQSKKKDPVPKRRIKSAADSTIKTEEDMEEENTNAAEEDATNNFPVPETTITTTTTVTQNTVENSDIQQQQNYYSNLGSLFAMLGANSQQFMTGNTQQQVMSSSFNDGHFSLKSPSLSLSNFLSTPKGLLNISFSPISQPKQTNIQDFNAVDSQRFDQLFDTVVTASEHLQVPIDKSTANTQHNSNNNSNQNTNATSPLSASLFANSQIPQTNLLGIVAHVADHDKFSSDDLLSEEEHSQREFYRRVLS